MVRRLSHVRTAMFCLYKYPHDFMTEIPKKEDIHMTVSFVIFTIVYGTVSSILGTYIVRIPVSYTHLTLPTIA